MEKYKILGAMFALREFTIEDLVRHSGVNRATIQSTVGRSRDLVEEVVLPKETRLRGGQSIKYRLRSDKVAAVKGDLDVIYDSLDRIRASSVTAFEPPLSLLTAEDSIERFALADWEERELLVSKAKLNLIAANSKLREVFSSEESKDHIKAIQKRLNAVSCKIKWAESLTHMATSIATLPQHMRANLEERLSEFMSVHFTRPSDLGDPVHAARSVLFVDAIQNEWTGSVRGSLRPGVAVSAVDALIDPSGFLHNLQEAHRQGDLDTCVVAFNSRNMSTMCRPFAEQLVGWWPHDNKRLLFLDSSFDGDLRNYLLGHHSNYFGKAATLREEALLSVLRLNAPLGKKSQSENDSVSMNYPVEFCI